ncbi:hypothetical protein K450DRAFT_263270 [Umbelopsis ramanniana AG]|uniref:Uncharacterized protein n=1 Tax=Umbelopsis ramanniana AG TaxID=1314678 RepID=A0AAD5H7K4_UMBRA|nr:uncharacterized protein K450DRAFT_263270 [Umbelopsis ramanniana AG]KAI8575102.1 hypothetical protein K450DRAFT_263270 [Umbelopsis ramanniana AG]
MTPYPTKRVKTLAEHTGAVHYVTYNKTGQYCLSGSRDRSIMLWNASTGARIQTYSAHGRDVLGISVTADNSRFASCGNDRTVFCWDVSTGSVIRRYAGHYESVNCVGFNDDGTVLASGSFDTTVRLWDCRSQNTSPIQILEDCKDSVMSLLIRGAELIVGSADGRLRNYDIRMGQLQEDYIGAAITSVRMSKDRNCILVSTTDDTIRLMDKANGTLLNEFKGHQHTEYKLQSAFSNDDAYVLSGSEDNKLYIWDLLEGNQVEALEGHKGIVTSIDYHPTETAMISGSVDGSIMIWE